jgi:hypothetical protein
MNEELKKAVQKSRVALQQAHPKERGAFKALLLTNPNYFGNLVASPFPPVLPISGNTFYEELGCVGYHPQQEQLEGVVYINQTSGYGSDVCGVGTTEYVRFYLSFDGGGTWQDQGLTSFQAYNIPEGTEGSKRLEYAVSLKVDPARKFCTANHLILVRAILSWNNPPPANQPNWTPVWGNVREATIQVEPFRFFHLPDLFDLSKAKLQPELKELVDLDAPIPLKKATLGAAALATLYRGKGVPTHRFAFKELSAFTTGKSALSAEAFTKLLPGVAFDPSIVDVLFPTDGNTSFEELNCIGLDPNTPDTLVGVIQIKKSAGYSGGPCTDGSVEYVTFWGDFDGNGTFETCLGTASVRVYDLPVPPQGIHYAVRLPVDLTQYRQACTEGPKVVPIRAILSWNVAPPCANPNYVPTWGNREETLINIAPTAQVPAGKIAILGGIPVGHIDDVTGLTTEDALFATNNTPPNEHGLACPFAGKVTVQGAPIAGYEYLVEVSPDGNIWTPVVTDLVLTDLNGNTAIHQANNVTKRFTYKDFNQNVNGLLAQWFSAGDALWYVRLTVFDGNGIQQGAPDVHRIQLDNTGPEASIVITSGAGSCGKFPVGTQLSGTFVARDTYLTEYTLGVEPAVNPVNVGIPNPNKVESSAPYPGTNINTAVAPGDPWTLDTTGMTPCGYVIRVVAVDRAIVNSQAVGHHSSDSDGFCLEEDGGGHDRG